MMPPVGDTKPVFDRCKPSRVPEEKPLPKVEELYDPNMLACEYSSGGDEDPADDGTPLPLAAVLA